MATSSGRVGTGRRSPPGGGNNRGDETRRRILGVASRMFGQDGYGATSTRAIARAAGVNPPALQYYFDDKAGLYRACVERLVDRIVKRLRPGWLRARERLGHDLDLEALIQLFCDVQDDLLDSFYEPDEGALVNVFRSRLGGQADEADAGWGVFRERVDRPIFEIVAMLTSRVTGEPVRSFENEANAMSLLGLSVICTHENEDALRTVAGLRQPTKDDIATLKRLVRRNAELLLRALSDDKHPRAT